MKSFKQSQSFAHLEDLLIHVIGGDWGKDDDFVADDFETVSCIRGSEFKNWKKELGATAVTRKIKSSSLETRRLTEGDFLIEISGGGPDQPVGRTVLITGQVLEQLLYPAVCTNFLRLARPSDFINSAYLNYYLTKFYHSGEVVNYQGGSNNLRNLKFKEYSKIEIPVIPLAEQKVIADKLDTLLAQVEATKARLDRIPQIIKTFRQSVLAAAVSGKLTEEWRKENEFPNNVLRNVLDEKKSWAKKNSDHNEVKRVLKRVKDSLNGINNKVPGLPEMWSWSQLEDSVLMIVDCHNKTAPYTEEGNPLIRTSNIRDGKFIWDNLRFVSDETYEYWSRRCPPEPGDIIFTREAPMGEAAIIPSKYKLCLGQRTMLIRPVEKYVSAKFLLMTLMDPNFRKRSEELAVGTGVKHYRVGDVSNLEIAIPPTEEQTQIVRRVEELFAFADSIEQKTNTALERVNNLTQSIMAKAFLGELTADWRAANADLISGDNSAEALLAKIKVERDAIKKQTKKKTQVKKAKV